MAGQTKQRSKVCTSLGWTPGTLGTSTASQEHPRDLGPPRRRGRIQGPAAGTEAPKGGHSVGNVTRQASGRGGGGGAWNSAQETFYSLWTSRSAEKVDEQLVTRAQGTPAAIAEPAIRFGLQASSALGDTMAAVAQGRRARKARSQKARPALPPFHPPLPLPSWTGPRCALGCHGNELPLRRINVPRNRASSAR